jgi:hypothetical protein
MKMMEKNYGTLGCVLCKTIFVSHHPRQRRCPNCLIAKCSECGRVINSAQLGRLRKNGKRFCAVCWAKPGPESHRAKPVGHKHDFGGGYVQIKTENGWGLEHRLAMGKKLGRALERGEIVHHEDRTKTNNEPGNLALAKNFRDHMENFHRAQLKTPTPHHFGKRKWGPAEYEEYNKSKQPNL